jgi:outer membrane protein assembly factor BamB
MRILVIVMVSLLQACTTIDDYMLGKDNTPHPKTLKKVSGSVKLTQNWSVPAGKAHQNNEYLKLKPVILGRTLYTASASGLVQALDKKDGSTQWSLQLKHGVVSGPSVADGLIAVGTNASTLVLMRAQDGKVLWETKLSGDILSLPTITHHKVIAKTVNGKVFAYNSADGKKIWVADHGAPSLILKASSSPVVLGNLVLIGFSDGKLDAIDIETGNVMWQRSIAFAAGSSDVERLVDIDADPIVKNNIAYIGSYQGYIGALSLDNGQFLWRKPGSVYKNMVLNHNSLYLTDSNDVLWSLDSKTGHVNWKQTALKARGLTEPVITGNSLVVGDKSGLLHVLDTQTGDITARTQLSGGITIAPHGFGKNLYVITENGMLNELSVG